MLPKLLAVLTWVKDNVLAVLIASFVIPGVLAVFNQQSEITKAIYETDYKGAKAKYIECRGLHSDYLSAASTNAGAAQMLQEHFNLEHAAKNTPSREYGAALAAALEAYRKSRETAHDLFGRTTRCYAELDSLYENLALALNLHDQYKNAGNPESEQIDSLIAQRDAIVKDLQKRTDPVAVFRAVIAGDAKQMQILMQRANFSDLASLQHKTVELETAVYFQQLKRHQVLNAMFSDELSRRFHRGLLSFFGSLFSI